MIETTKSICQTKIETGEFRPFCHAIDSFNKCLWLWQSTYFVVHVGSQMDNYYTTEIVSNLIHGRGNIT